jgi:hypothetical protein
MKQYFFVCEMYVKNKHKNIIALTSKFAEILFENNLNFFFHFFSILAAEVVTILRLGKVIVNYFALGRPHKLP